MCDYKILASTPPMGWNSWNTFGTEINEDLIKETADAMVKYGYRDAGYEYVSLDDCWAERSRDKNGRLVADHKKFPSGIKALADYVHERGLKLGIYSCAGVATCANYPGSYGHEYEDAETFAEWGVDLLKYDYCYFPESADGRNSYLTMSMALRACGREILFSACNWGYDSPEVWMRGIGAHMYRSGTDIRDNYMSFKNIALDQIKKFDRNAPGCFNDIDMLTVGMRGKGYVTEFEPGDMTWTDYVTQFSFWAFMGAPLILGGDVRNMDEESKKLVLNKELIRINQDKECRPPIAVYGHNFHLPDVTDRYIMFRLLENNEFALGFFSLGGESVMNCTFTDCGLPTQAGYGFELTNVMTGENYGICRDYIEVSMEEHSSLILRGKIVKCDENSENVTICKYLVKE